MSTIPLIKAAQVSPMVRALQDIGAPVERISERARMPLDTVLSGEGALGEYSVWRFLELAARREAYEFLGYAAAQRNPILTLGELGGFQLQLAPTLGRILQRFVIDICTESSASDHRLVADDGGVWYRRVPPFSGSDGSWQAEQYCIAAIIQIVRLCAGADWLPPEMRICAVEKPAALPEEWRQIRVNWGCAATEIRIPATALVNGPRLSPPSAAELLVERCNGPQAQMRIVDLIASQIRSQRVSLRAAAEETGLSVATFKRRLAEHDTNYSEIVASVRLDLALKTLAQTAVPISEIALDLGYSHLQNFTRAFSRQVGISPARYRRLEKQSAEEKSLPNGGPSRT